MLMLMLILNGTEYGVRNGQVQNGMERYGMVSQPGGAGPITIINQSSATVLLFRIDVSKHNKKGMNNHGKRSMRMNRAVS